MSITYYVFELMDGKETAKGCPLSLRTRRNNLAQGFMAGIKLAVWGPRQPVARSPLIRFIKNNVRFNLTFFTFTKYTRSDLM